MKRRLLVIVDHPLLSVAALDNRPEELLPLDARDVPRSVDDSFKPNFLLLLAHMITERFGCARDPRGFCDAARQVPSRQQYRLSAERLFHLEQVKTGIAADLTRQGASPLDIPQAGYGSQESGARSQNGSGVAAQQPARFLQRTRQRLGVAVAKILAQNQVVTTLFY